LAAAADRITYCLDDIHKVEACGCKPETATYLLNGVSSNADISTSNDPELRKMKQMLEGITETQSGVTIIIPAVDGLTTNLEGLMVFFEPFRRLDIVLLLLNDDECQEYQLNKVLDVASQMPDGGTVLSSPENYLVRMMVKAGLNKIQYVYFIYSFRCR
jgi:uncharacterized protein YlzI (FlbEa/FlbD family)